MIRIKKKKMKLISFLSIESRRTESDDATINFTHDERAKRAIPRIFLSAGRPVARKKTLQIRLRLRAFHAAVELRTNNNNNKKKEKRNRTDVGDGNSVSDFNRSMFIAAIVFFSFVDT